MLIPTKSLIYNLSIFNLDLKKISKNIFQILIFKYKKKLETNIQVFYIINDFGSLK